MLHGLILAGGQGTRLWPHSRHAQPKQFLALTSDRTMLQDAYGRLAPLIAPEQTLVMTGREYSDLVTSQLSSLPADNIVGEPVGKGTATAIGLAAVLLSERDPDAVMAVVTADHLIREPAAFRDTLVAAAGLADEGWLVTLGIRPTRPDTGFGYLQRGEVLGEASGLLAFRVRQFVEKPDAANAASFIEAGDHDWNSGMFVWRADRILAEMEQSMPDLYEGLLRIRACLRAGSSLTAAIDDAWDDLPTQTIDYGVMEHAQQVAMLSVDIGWSDIGTWQTLYEVLPHDDRENAVVGPHLGLDSHTSLVIGKKRLITTIGIRDIAIIDSDDVLLVCPRDRVQDVRQMVAMLRAEGLESYLAADSSN